MIAALPMYDRPETAAANDRLWAGIRDNLRGRGIAAPGTLTRERPAFDIWTDPALVLAQTCGLPYRTRLHGQVSLVGTPDHGLADCPPGYYFSAVVARADAPPAAGAGRLAFNARLSQSGYAAIMLHARQHGWQFGELVETGSHHASAQAVAEGRADIAAIDAVSWAQMRRWDRFTDDLQVVAHTAPTPALPFIAAPNAPSEALFKAIGTAIAALSAPDRETLHLRGIVAIPAAEYLAVPDPENA